MVVCVLPIGFLQPLTQQPPLTLPLASHSTSPLSPPISFATMSFNSSTIMITNSGPERYLVSLVKVSQHRMDSFLPPARDVRFSQNGGSTAAQPHQWIFEPWIRLVLNFSCLWPHSSTLWLLSSSLAPIDRLMARSMAYEPGGSSLLPMPLFSFVY